jgi:anti-sigma factor RsiW
MRHLGERLTDFVFGELSSNDMEEARRHVDVCGACRDQVEQFERTRSMLRMSPDAEPPRRIMFEFERPRAIWRWLVPAGVAAAVMMAVLIAAPIQIQWRDSQLTVAFGKMPASVPVVSPVVNSQPAPQPIDYERIIRQVESSERTWLEDELKKHDVEQLRQIRLSLEGNWKYLEAQQQRLEKENAENSANIQRIVDRSGEQ